MVTQGQPPAQWELPHSRRARLFPGAAAQQHGGAQGPPGARAPPPPARAAPAQESPSKGTAPGQPCVIHTSALRAGPLRANFLPGVRAQKGDTGGCACSGLASQTWPCREREGAGAGPSAPTPGCCEGRRHTEECAALGEATKKRSFCKLTNGQTDLPIGGYKAPLPGVCDRAPPGRGDCGRGPDRLLGLQGRGRQPEWEKRGRRGIIVRSKGCGEGPTANAKPEGPVAAAGAAGQESQATPSRSCWWGLQWEKGESFAGRAWKRSAPRGGRAPRCPGEGRGSGPG